MTRLISSLGNHFARNARFLFVLLTDRRGLFLPRLVVVLAIAAFLAYTTNPVQLIPQHVPIFGYADDLCILVLGFLLARRLTPRQLLSVQGDFTHASHEHAVPVPRGFGRGAVVGDGIGVERPTAPVSLYDLVGYRRAWQIQAPFAPKTVSQAPIIVVGGSGRSGTTLLRTILNRHPSIYCGDESTVFLNRISSAQDIAQRYRLDTEDVDDLFRASRSQAEFIDLFRKNCLGRSAKSIWAEKTPDNILRFDFVREHFPNALLVHVIRDGRDVVCSLRRQSWLKVPPDRRDTLEAVEVAIDYWIRHIETGLRFRNDPRYVEFKYEDMIHQPEETLAPLFAAAGVEWTPTVLVPTDGNDKKQPHENAINTNALEQWRRELRPEEVELIERKAGPLLRSLGYSA
ncbi:MAG TPA: sulfotransferase [Magnetospirillaceae bacterium]|jgi:uncharacterized membrane protein YkvA (DUF1232 family)